jgi:hypothetical protein
MKRAFLLRVINNDNPLTTASVMIEMCRPQTDIDYIIYCLKSWEVGVCIQTMKHCPLRDRIAKFQCKNNLGNKYVKQYVLEEIQAPGSDTPHTVQRRREKGITGKIVVSREEAFDCIDEWHQSNGHMGQERTWGYCREKYFNMTQELIKHNCETCPVCMRKNHVTQPAPGSRKPIRSIQFRDRFQIDLIDFCKLRNLGRGIPLVSSCVGYW